MILAHPCNASLNKVVLVGAKLYRLLSNIRFKMKCIFFPYYTYVSVYQLKY